MNVWIELRPGLFAELDEAELIALGIPTAKIDLAKEAVKNEMVKRYV